MLEAERLAAAINAGFIQISIDPDGVMRYSLTEKGYIQWKQETGQRNPMLEMFFRAQRSEG
jgi:hypothetical protein